MVPGFLHPPGGKGEQGVGIGWRDCVLELLANFRVAGGCFQGQPGLLLAAAHPHHHRRLAFAEIALVELLPLDAQLLPGL